MKDKIYSKEEYNRAIDCITQHIKIFHKQAIHEEIASFGKPCQLCPYFKECNHDWISIMNPLILHSSIQISMCMQDIPDKRDDKHLLNITDATESMIRGIEAALEE